jgi:arylformamidase
MPNQLTTAIRPRRTGSRPDDAELRIVDLSQGWAEGMAKFEAAWYPKFQLNRVMTPATDPAGVSRTFTELHIFPHNGTHVESSLHFDPAGDPLEALELSRFVGWACVADLSHVRDLEPVTAEGLEQSVGAVWEPGMRLLIRTDHALRHRGADDYWDTAPYLDASAAQWIVERRAALVGLDCITERPGDPAFPIHRQILLHELREAVVWLFAAPVKVDAVEASPVRAVAVEGLLGPG